MTGSTMTAVPSNVSSDECSLVEDAINVIIPRSDRERDALLVVHRYAHFTNGTFPDSPSQDCIRLLGSRNRWLLALKVLESWGALTAEGAGRGLTYTWHWDSFITVLKAHEEAGLVFPGEDMPIIKRTVSGVGKSAKAPRPKHAENGKYVNIFAEVKVDEDEVSIREAAPERGEPMVGGVRDGDPGDGTGREERGSADDELRDAGPSAGAGLPEGTGTHPGVDEGASGSGDGSDVRGGGVVGLGDAVDSDSPAQDARDGLDPAATTDNPASARVEGVHGGEGVRGEGSDADSGSRNGIGGKVNMNDIINTWLESKNIFWVADHNDQIMEAINGIFTVAEGYTLHQPYVNGTMVITESGKPNDVRSRYTIEEAVSSGLIVEK